MYVPVHLLLWRQPRVPHREEPFRDPRSDVYVDEGITHKGSKDFVDVMRKGDEAERFGEGLHSLGEGRDRRDGKRIMHVDSRSLLKN